MCAGSGDDIIVLPAGAAPSAEQDRRRCIQSDGSDGHADHHVEHHDSGLRRDVGADRQPNFRLFAVGSTGHLTIRRAYIRGFRGARRQRRRRRRRRDGAGGAVYVMGGGWWSKRARSKDNARPAELAAAAKRRRRRHGRQRRIRSVAPAVLPAAVAAAAAAARRGDGRHARRWWRRRRRNGVGTHGAARRGRLRCGGDGGDRVTERR